MNFNQTNQANFNLPEKVLAGYWFQWLSAPEDGANVHTWPEEIPPEYNIIVVAFKLSPGIGQIPTFRPDPNFLGEQGFINAVNLWKSQGREVLISLGGAAGNTQVRRDQKEAFKNEMRRVINDYGFTGVDINLENTSIAAADNQTVIPEVLNELKAEFNQAGRKFFITMAPEFPYLRPGGVGGVTYRAYLDNTNYDLIMPQYYNQAGDGVNMDRPPWWVANSNVAGREDFIYFLTKALVTGTDGHLQYFQIPANKLAIGFPSTPNAAYGTPRGVYYTDPDVIAAAINQLRNSGIDVRGVMTWSINQDKQDIGRGPFDFGRRVGAFLGLPEQGGGSTVPTPPSAPTGLHSTHVDTHSITISWQASTGAVIGYGIYRDGIRIGSVGAMTTTFTDNTLFPNTLYTFQVRADGESGTASTLSQELVVHTKSETSPSPDPGGTLNPPMNLRITGQTETTISMAWDAPDSGITVNHYEIFRDGVKIADVPSTAGLTFTDTNLSPGQMHSYTVRSFAQSGFSNEASGTTESETVVTPELLPPTNLTVATTRFTLNWLLPISTQGITGYRIYRNNQVVKEVDVHTTTFTDSELIPNTTYTYVVESFNQSGNTARSNPLTVSTTTG